MSWATPHIKRLRAGETISFRPHGRSMEPRIFSGQLVTVEPCNVAKAKHGDVVLCRVGGLDLLHLVVGSGPRGLEIANNKGRVNGWTRAVYGRVVEAAAVVAARAPGGAV